MDRRWVLFVLAACTGPTGPQEHTVAQAITQCPDQVVEGVDLSTGNGMVDWDALEADGRNFAFIKATQGNYNQQLTPAASSFATNWAAAQAAGVLRSPYHYFDGTIDGVTQANYFLDAVTAAGGLQIGDLPPMLDLECPTSSSESASAANCEYTGNSGWVDPDTLAQEIFDWLDTVHTATGTMPIIYSYLSWFASVSDTDPRLATYPLFIASYNACASIPSPWTAATFWQYSDNGTAAGINSNVDLDRFFGSAGDLAALTIQATPPPSLVDAGIQATSDAGTGSSVTPPPEQNNVGCGCHSGGSPGSLAVGAALFVIVLRRRKVAR